VPGQHTSHDRNLPSFEQDEAIQLAADHYGLDGDWQQLTGERDLNYRVETTDGSFVFKIANENDDEDVVGFQVEALRHIALRDPNLPVPRVYPDKDGNCFHRIAGSAGTSNIIRLMSFLPGVPAQDAEITHKTFRETGRFMGRLNVALSSFYHHSARKNDHPWDVSRCLRFQSLSDCIKEADGRAVLNSVFDRFRTSVKPRLDATRHQIIHHDAHPGNVLVDPLDPEKIVGLIDFGDMLYGPVVADLAVTVDVSIAQFPDLQQVMNNVALGFDSAFALHEDEIDLVFDVVAVRAALTAVIAASWIEQDPDGPQYIESYVPYVDAVEQLLSIGHEKGTRELRRTCRFPTYCPRSPDEASDESLEKELLGKRHRYMGEKTTHFYERPMHFERASGAYLYATDGHKYLDCYNNVPQVGHCNPHVVRAISRQAAALNTNTRYLYSSIIEYAERLTDKLAPHLDACVFVNSGTEANDIAWQMAKIATGNSGALLMEDAYHGITEAIREFSPGHPDVPLPSHLQGLIVPDTYRGPFREDTPDVAIRYAEDADRAIADLAKEGHDVAAFMIDSALCSSGVPDAPDGYMLEIEKRVRAAGGLMICDEVQSGFGRMGEWWGHEFHGVTADIVTMGKPVGNGHPLGVIVTTAEILRQFIDKTGLFSTFGGNTVACAAGNAVIDVIERDELIENGREVGDYLRDSLRELANTQALIGDVRGNGMLAGLEFVTDRDTRTPATEETLELLELMRQRHVLVGKEGRYGNILKLRPPLVFQREHVEQLVSALDSVLSELRID
jgi:4-aminobutyrate aminotransferase-like enzyme/Ser/Thr protein kinase RdoA (MazF antagonist)